MDNITWIEGYTPVTNTWRIFTTVERTPFDTDEEVLFMYDEVFDNIKDDYRKLTELVIVLERKTLDHNGDSISNVYEELTTKCKDYINSHFTKEELNYYHRFVK
jgi:hypothetical protein